MPSYMLMQFWIVTRETNTSAVSAPEVCIADGTSAEVAVSSTNTMLDVTPALSNTGLSSTFATACPDGLFTATIATDCGWNCSIVNFAMPWITPTAPAVKLTPAGVRKSSVVSPLPMSTAFLPSSVS